jgi:hypothetical protein
MSTAKEESSCRKQVAGELVTVGGGEEEGCTIG